MTRTVGCVDIDSHGLSAKCAVCGKTISYPIGSGLSNESFKEKLAEFIKSHNALCGGKSGS